LKELLGLREKVKRLEEEVKKARDLEKKCKLLEETIKAKNPNSIPMMLQAVKETTTTDKAEVSDLKSRIKSLEFQLDEKDKEFEKKLRTLR
jgi:predicted  nucleic acid-binding Zn-ribbon protein